MITGYLYQIVKQGERLSDKHVEAPWLPYSLLLGLCRICLKFLYQTEGFRGRPI